VDDERFRVLFIRSVASLTAGVYAECPEDYEEMFERAAHRICTGERMKEGCSQLGGLMMRRGADKARRQGKG
jgi:hypothetical protein